MAWIHKNCDGPKFQGLKNCPKNLQMVITSTHSTKMQVFETSFRTKKKVGHHHHPPLLIIFSKVFRINFNNESHLRFSSNFSGNFNIL
jgi:hypothetical protein